MSNKENFEIESKKINKQEKFKAKLEKESIEARKLSIEKIQSKVITKNTPFEISESYKSIRTNIMFSLKNEENCKSLIITSANPSEGKSTNCVNLSISFAQTGSKVVIIDADMRKPRVHKYFGLKNKVGLSNILGGFSTIEDAIIKAEEYPLDVITAGHIPPNPAELLASKEMDMLIEKLSKEYDYILFDTPPINVVTDAALLSEKVSGVILMVRHKASTHDTIERAIKSLELANANIIGFVLNSVDQKVYAERYTYGMYRKKKYGYGNKYRYGGYGYGSYRYGSYGYGYGSGQAELLDIDQKKDNNKQ